MMALLIIGGVVAHLVASSVTAGVIAGTAPDNEDWAIAGIASFFFWPLIVLAIGCGYLAHRTRQLIQAPRRPELPPARVVKS